MCVHLLLPAWGWTPSVPGPMQPLASYERGIVGIAKPLSLCYDVFTWIGRDTSFTFLSSLLKDLSAKRRVFRLSYGDKR